MSNSGNKPDDAKREHPGNFNSSENQVSNTGKSTVVESLSEEALSSISAGDSVTMGFLTTDQARIIANNKADIMRQSGVVVKEGAVQALYERLLSEPFNMAEFEAQGGVNNNNI